MLWSLSLAGRFGWEPFGSRTGRQLDAESNAAVALMILHHACGWLDVPILIFFPSSTPCRAWTTPSAAWSACAHCARRRAGTRCGTRALY